MPYKSALARLPVRRKNIKDPPVAIPAVLRLPDGREIATESVTNRVTNRVAYNLRQGMAYEYRNRRKIAKQIDKPGKNL